MPIQFPQALHPHQASSAGFNRSAHLLQLVLTLEEQVEDLAHLVLPVDGHHEGVGLGADGARLELDDARLHEDLAALAALDLAVPGVGLPLLDGPEVADGEGGGGDELVAEDHGEDAGVLVDDGGSSAAVLDTGVSAELLLGGEDAVGVGDGVSIDFLLAEVGGVEVEALHAFAQSVVEEGLVELHVPVHDALLQQLGQPVVVHVGGHHLLFLRRQPRARHHLPQVRHAQVCHCPAHQAPRQEASHQQSPIIYRGSGGGGRARSGLQFKYVQ